MRVTHQVAKSATVTATAVGAAIPNTSQSPLTMSLLVYVDGTVTGTTPSLVYNLEVSNDNVHWFSVASTTAITATAGKQRAVATSIVESFYRVSPAVTGTTPSFGGVTVEVVLLNQF